MPVPADWYQRQEEVWAEYQQSLDPFGRAYDELFSKLVWAESASSWQELTAWLSELQGSWCFRGQRESEWPLRTSLDRAVLVTTPSGHQYLGRRPIERELLFRFQQQAHQFIRHVPPDDDKASWWALMQHYGVPTRLLDWTRSPYVALYFAIEEAPRNTVTRNPAIWAINLQWLEAKEKKQIGSIPSEAKARTAFLNGLLDQSKTPLIVRINPSQANERMFAQQGFFLWKLLGETPFFDQVLISMVLDPIQEQPVIRKLEVHESLRISFLETLRNMNIHRASLFPGLDGFCQSLKVDLEIKVAHQAARTASADVSGKS